MAYSNSGDKLKSYYIFRVFQHVIEPIEHRELPAFAANHLREKPAGDLHSYADSNRPPRSPF
jgi:hypothetical protein